MIRKALLGAVMAAVSLCSTALAVPSPTSHSGLRGVSCTSKSNCWAVGQATTGAGARLNQSLHWTGRKWASVSTPQPGGTGQRAFNELLSVSCPSASDCWAVGDHTNGAGAILATALHWNGHTWSTASIPEPGGTSQGAITDLYGVSCTSVSDCWAVGNFTDSSSAFLNLALQWDGNSWSSFPTPDPAGTNGIGEANNLFDVACVSATGCWAVGDFASKTRAVLNQILSWNGSQWVRVSAPEPGGKKFDAVNALSAVSCISVSNCWAVGSYKAPRTKANLNEALHWGGSRWSRMPTPEPAGTGPNAVNQLSGISCTSTSACWAVGVFSNRVGADLNQALRWNGRKWSRLSTPEPGGTRTPGDFNVLHAVSCTSASNCWAVGAISRRKHQSSNEALHWNGRTWSVG